MERAVGVLSWPKSQIMRALFSLLVVGLFSTEGAAQCSSWVEPDSSFTVIPDSWWFLPSWVSTNAEPADDGSYGPIALPFEFQFFGTAYDSVYINTNGTISFDRPEPVFNPIPFPDEYLNVIAPFWGDIDMRGYYCDGCDQASFKVTPSAFIVTWDSVRYWPFSNSYRYNTFQVIITDGVDPLIPNGNNVRFSYKNMQWATSNGWSGANGAGGFPAMVGINVGLDTVGISAQIGRFSVHGNNYDGPYATTSGVDVLDNSWYDWNTTHPAAVPPVIGWSLDCDTLVVEVGEELQLNATVIAGQVGQTALAQTLCETLLSLSSSQVGSDSVITITAIVTPVVEEIGFHQLLVEARDAVDTTLLSTSSVVIHVIPAITTEVIGRYRSEFSVYPSPATHALRYTLPEDMYVDRIDIRTIDGRTLHRATVDPGSRSGELDVRLLPPGVYVLQADGLSQRFVKQ